MPAVYGQVSTYSSNNSLGNLHLSIEDLVGRYPAKKYPLLNRLNGKIFKKEIDNSKYQWNEEQLRPVIDVLNGAVNSSVTTVVATAAGIFNVDDVIRIDSEQLIVTAVAADGVTLTVSRGWGGTTAASHSNAVSIYRIGVAAPEGADADGAVTQPLTTLYNYTQIFEDVVQLTGTEEEAFLYKTDQGNDNASNQITIKQQELMEMLQTSLLLGARFDDGVKRRSMGGLKYFIDTYASANVVHFGGTGSEWTTQSTLIPSAVSGEQYTQAQEKLDTLIQSLVLNRATPTAIYVGYKTLRRMTLWNVGIHKTDREDKKLGYGVPAQYMSEAGELDIVFVPGNALDNILFVVDETRFGFKAFKNRGWFTEKLAKTGDSSKWQVLGEYTAKVGVPGVHGYMDTLGL